LLALFSGSFLRGAIGQMPPKIGVTDFYAPTPLGDFLGFIPEHFAAADLTDSLSRAAAGKFTIIPRATMEEAQTGMQWHGVDAPHYDRLGALARAVGADWLVTGWITQLVINSAARLHGNHPSPNSEVQKWGYATVVVQMFNASEGRIVSQTTKYASTASGELRSELAARVLHDALQPTVPCLVNAVSSRLTNSLDASPRAAAGVHRDARLPSRGSSQ